MILWITENTELSFFRASCSALEFEFTISCSSWTILKDLPNALTFLFVKWRWWYYCICEFGDKLVALGTTSSYLETELFKLGNLVVEELRNGGKRGLLCLTTFISKLFLVLSIVLLLLRETKGECLFLSSLPSNESLSRFLRMLSSKCIYCRESSCWSVLIIESLRDIRLPWKGLGRKEAITCLLVLYFN